MKGKLIVVEGTDCSGKETQTKKLIEKLEKEGYKVMQYGFPDYDSPTGKIIGGPYLGKAHICEGWFEEGAANVDPHVAAAYYIADRKYNEKKILDALNNGIHVILDRYTYSNMAHQGGKIFDKDERLKMYNFINTLEFELYELVKPDIKIFLHMPLEAANILKQGRLEKPDQHEMDENHLKNAEKAYIEIANLYDFKTIECSNKLTGVTKEDIKSIDEINNEIFEYVKRELNIKQKRI